MRPLGLRSSFEGRKGRLMATLTGDAARWPHLEACYALAQRAAAGFAPPTSAEAAFTAARWGLVMGLAIARLDGDLAEAVWTQLEEHDRSRDGDDAALFARRMMLRDMQRLTRDARRNTGAGP